jgi:N-acetylmuramoyl-L-alanine amidase CwlA
MATSPTVSFAQRYPITSRYLTAPSRRRSGIPMTNGVKFVVAHDTGNPNSTAAGNVTYYERSRDEESASAHLFVDDRQIIECIPALNQSPEKAWHVRYNVPGDNRLFNVDANDAAIGVEYCFGSAINADEAYRRYVWVLALVCVTYQLDPTRSIVGHFFLDPGRKTDPVTGLAHSRRTYDQLLRDVASEVAGATGATPQAPAGVTSFSGTAQVHHAVNLRSAANRRADIVRVAQPGERLVCTAQTDTGEPVNGNAVWYQTDTGSWFWSGAARVA